MNKKEIVVESSKKEPDYLFEALMSTLFLYVFLRFLLPAMVLLAWRYG